MSELLLHLLVVGIGGKLSGQLLFLNFKICLQHTERINLSGIHGHLLTESLVVEVQLVVPCTEAEDDEQQECSQSPDGTTIGTESLLAEQIHTLCELDARGQSLLALRLDKAETRTIDRKLDLITRLQIVGPLNRTTVHQSRIGGREMDQLPVVAVADDGSVLAADGVEGFVVTNLTRGTTDLNLVDDDFL